MMSNLTLVGSLIKLRCQVGNRIMTAHDQILVPPTLEPSLFNITWQISNDSMLCVPAAFGNLFYILHSTELAETIKSSFIADADMSTNLCLEKCLQMAGQDFSYKSVDIAAVSFNVKDTPHDHFACIERFTNIWIQPLQLKCLGIKSA